MFKFFISTIVSAVILFFTANALAWCVSADNTLATFLTGPVSNWEGVQYTPQLETAYGFISAAYVEFSGYGNRSCPTRDDENTLNYLEIDGYQTSNNQQRNYVTHKEDIVCSGTCPDNDFKNCNGLEYKQTRFWTITCKTYPW